MWSNSPLSLSLCIAVKGTGNKSAVPQAMNVMISPAVHNAIFSRPWAQAGINLLKHYILEADVQGAEVILNSVKSHIINQVVPDVTYCWGRMVNKVTDGIFVSVLLDSFLMQDHMGKHTALYIQQTGLVYTGPLTGHWTTYGSFTEHHQLQHLPHTTP